MLKNLAGRILTAIQDDRLETLRQVMEIKISGQPHIVYVNGYRHTMLADEHQ